MREEGAEMGRRERMEGMKKQRVKEAASGRLPGADTGLLRACRG